MSCCEIGNFWVFCSLVLFYVAVLFSVTGLLCSHLLGFIINLKNEGELLGFQILVVVTLKHEICCLILQEDSLFRT